MLSFNRMDDSVPSTHQLIVEVKCSCLSKPCLDLSVDMWLCSNNLVVYHSSDGSLLPGKLNFLLACFNFCSSFLKHAGILFHLLSVMNFHRSKYIFSIFLKAWRLRWLSLKLVFPCKNRFLQIGGMLWIPIGRIVVNNLILLLCLQQGSWSENFQNLPWNWHGAKKQKVSEHVNKKSKPAD